jgi:hypothetical protein
MLVADGNPTNSMFTHLKEGTQLMTIYTPYFYIIQDKTKQTIKLKYGYNIVNVSQAEEVKRKKEETNLYKRGVDNPSKDPVIKEKKRLQQIEKSNRECVIKLSCFNKQHKILLPKSWYLKDEKFIQEKIIEIEKLLIK